MRLFSRKLVFGAPVLGAVLSVYACGSNDYDSCEASRTCAPSANDEGGNGGAGSASTSGAGGSVTSPAGGQGGEGEPINGQGGSDEPGAAGAGGAPESVDTTKPTVVSITPVQGATGITSDTPIVVTFSEPMNRDLAEDGFFCGQLTGEVTFSWNDEGTVLTVTQEGGLEYAEGVDETFTAKLYTVIIQPYVTDVAGNTIQSVASASFQTLRHVKMPLPITVDGDSIRHDNELREDFRVGDDGGDNRFRAYVGFDFSALPWEREIEAAVLELFPETIYGTPFASLGDLLFDQIHTSSFTFTEPMLDNRVAVITSAKEGAWMSVDVTTSFKNDYLNRLARDDETQLRLRFATSSDYDGGADRIEFSDGTDPVAQRPRLTVSYFIE